MCITKNTTHGDSTSKEHCAWKAMKARCYNKNGEHYHLYGGRGIKVAQAWKSSYSTFLSDMGRAPDTGETWSIGRIDNNSDYSAANCKWEVYTEQARNRGMQVNNKSGHTGVHFRLNSNGRGLGLWEASWHDLNGKRRSKGFTLFKYGSAAKELAVLHRASAIAGLNNEGAGYSDVHGLKREIKG